MSRHVSDRTQDLILSYLSKYGFKSTLRAFEDEIGRKYDLSLDTGEDLQVIVNTVADSRAAEDRKETRVDPVTRYIAGLRTESSPLPDYAAGGVLPIEHTGNILAVTTSPTAVSAYYETGATSGLHHVAAHAVGKRLIATAAASRNVSVHTFGEWEKVVTFSTAPTSVVGLSFHPVKARLLAMGSLDGAVALVDALTGANLQTFKEHSRYVNCVSWCSAYDAPFAGAAAQHFYLAASSHDRSVSVYGPLEKGPGGAVSSLTQDRQTAVPADDPDAAVRASFVGGADTAARMGVTIQKSYVGVAERLCWLKGVHSRWVAVAVRDDSRLHYLEPTTGRAESHSLNANGDDHVAFSPVDVQASACGRFVSVLSDAHRVIVYGVRSDVQYATLFGPTTGVYYQCAHKWLPDNRTVVVSSSDGHVVMWIDVPTGRTLQRLSGHTGTVRDLWYDTTTGWVISGSFDKTIRVWKQGEAKGE